MESGVDAITDLTLYDHDAAEQVTPAAVYDAFYRDVDDALAAGDHTAAQQQGQHYIGKKQVADAMYPNAEQPLTPLPVGTYRTGEGDHRFTATISWADGAEESFTVTPYTEEWLECIETPPRVYFLDSQETDRRYVMRRWSMYDDDMLARLQNNSHYFNRSSHNDYLFERLGTSRFVADYLDDGFTTIPEPYFETALHRDGGIYDTYEDSDLFAPVTPPDTAVVEIMDDDTVYALRDWLDPVDARDTVDESMFGRFYAACEALGVLSCFDRQGDEFYLHPTEPFLLFGDPEFVAHTANTKWFETSDWDDFQRSVGDATARSLDTGQVKDWKDRITADLDIPDHALIDATPASIDPDLFPDEKRIPTYL